MFYKIMTIKIFLFIFVRDKTFLISRKLAILKHYKINCHTKKKLKLINLLFYKFSTKSILDVIITIFILIISNFNKMSICILY